MTTTTKSSAAPFSASAYSNPKGLTATTAATSSYDTTANTAFKIVSMFKLYVLGQSDANEEPTKSMTKWSSETLSNRTTNSVNASSNVSSFAIVVDIDFKAKFDNPVYCPAAANAAQA